jgi:O-antigen/teichoic acid export membrane protein
MLGAAALTPIISRLSAVQGTGDQRRLHADFQRINHLWLLVIVGGTVVGAASVYPLITAWLGHGYGEAVVFAEILVVAYGLSVLAGTRLAYLRATNQIGLEARTGVLVVAANLAFTVPLALWLGGIGVVIGTLLSNVVGVTFFVVRFNRLAPPVAPMPLARLVRAMALAVLFGALALGWGAAMVWLLPAGVALPPTAIGVVAAFLGYLAVTTGIRPTRAQLSAWLVPPTEPTAAQ